MMQPAKWRFPINDEPGHFCAGGGNGLTLGTAARAIIASHPIEAQARQHTGELESALVALKSVSPLINTDHDAGTDCCWKEIGLDFPLGQIIVHRTRRVIFIPAEYR